MKKFIQKNLLAGILVIIPIGLTYIVLSFVINGLDRAMSPLINAVIKNTGIPLPEGFHLPGLGLILVCLFIFLVGLLATNYFGKKIVEVGDLILNKIPFVRGIYSTIKKVVNTISESSIPSFKELVLVKYPDLSLNALGVVSGDTRGEPAANTREDMVNVFVPTLPNVTIGFMIMVPREDVIPMDMTVEDGLKMMISFGILTPEQAKSAGEG